MRYLFIFLFAVTYRCFSQTGLVWNDPIPVASETFRNLHPRIALDRQNDPVIIWGNDYEAAVYFSKWNGTAFSMPQKINPGGMVVFAASWAGPDLAAYGDTIYIVYKQSPEDLMPAYLQYSYDGGTTFSLPVQIDDINDSISRFPCVTTDQVGNPVVGFMKFNPDFSNARYVAVKSNDYGYSFSTDILASTYSGGKVCDCCPATITSVGNYAALLYRDNLSNIRNSWAGISYNGGETFPEGIQVDQNDWMLMSCPSSGPDGIIAGDSLYSVFMSAASGYNMVYFSRSSLSDLSDESDQEIEPYYAGLDMQNYPRIANYGNSAALLWIESAGGTSSIKTMFTADITEPLPDVYDIVSSSETPGIENADIILSPDAVHIVWQDNVSGKVMYRKATYSQPEYTNDIPENFYITVYPVPAKDEVTIKWNDNEAEIEQIFCTNLSGGKLKLTYKMQSNQAVVDISELTPGYYSLHLITTDGRNLTSCFLLQ